MAATTEIGRLVEAAAAGDQSAWSRLVHQFAGLIWAITRAYHLDPPAAADVSQTVWLRLVENLDRIRDPDHVGAWLATTTRREAQAVLRRTGRQSPTEVDEELESHEAGDPPVDVGMLRSERDRALWRAVAALSPRCQALLLMLMGDPRPSYEEVAAALDMPIGSIGPTRARCLEKLHEKVVLAGITGNAGDSSR